MKEIIYNENNINENEINNYVKRAKIIIENSKDEILIVYCNKNYFLPGGHVDNNEDFDECLIREIKEETGNNIDITKVKLFMTIKYLCKNYPKENTNTEYISNYYYIKHDLIPNFDNINLTEDEIKGNFKLEYINKKDIIDLLENSLTTCTKTNVVRDTIKVIKQYLKSNY